MNDFNVPVQSLKSLVIATVLATLLAAVILILAVLPAEYGIDPTGIGKSMGLTALSVQAEESAKPMVISCKEQMAQWNDSVTIIVPANSGLEYKFHLVKGAALDFSWVTDGGKLYFDFHGEPKGDKTGYFKSFKEATSNQSSGSLSAPFEGSHGWYWENKTRAPVTVFLNTKGDYRVLGLI